LILVLSNAVGAVFALVMAPFRRLPLTGMIVISVLTGVLMLVIYKYTSNQRGITTAKDRLKAHFLAIMLYKDSLGVLLRSIGNILRWNLVYMARNLRPLLVMMAPVILLLAQLNAWYGYRPLAPGEAAVVNVKVDKRINLSETPAVLSADQGVAVETDAVRMTLTGEIAWRVRATQPGEHTLTVRVGENQATTPLIVGAAGRLYRLSPLRHNGNFWDSVLYPGEPKLAGKITQIEVRYPDEKMNVFGRRVHWIIVYFALSILFGLSMKGVFKVDI
jgi:hypothetical protein